MANPRFIVTSLSGAQWEARALYEDFYCARGEMENRIKEQQLDQGVSTPITGLKISVFRGSDASASSKLLLASPAILAILLKRHAGRLPAWIRTSVN